MLKDEFCTREARGCIILRGSRKQPHGTRFSGAHALQERPLKEQERPLLKM